LRAQAAGHLDIQRLVTYTEEDQIHNLIMSTP
jgi:hypothetical protein